MWYKLAYDYKISSKFVSIMCSMYHNLSGRVQTSTDISNTFNISIGLQQGCNLSPYLFNLCINDLSLLLDKAGIDPVRLNGRNISSLLYADDMVLLSFSESGLQKALTILEQYCSRWQLVVNIKKTKVMVFGRKQHTVNFIYKGSQLATIGDHRFLHIPVSLNQDLWLICPRNQRPTQKGPQNLLPYKICDHPPQCNSQNIHESI